MKIVLNLIALAGLSAAPYVAGVTRYEAGLEGSQWYLTSSIFECTLTHNIPRFGRGVFYHEAGEGLRFYLDAPRPLMQQGKSALVIEAPSWRPGVPVEDLGYVATLEQSRALWVNDERATQMMDGLLQGMEPTFTRKARYADEIVKVGLSPINFEPMYNDYLGCVAGLLPVNYRQIERSVLLFSPSDVALTDEDKKRLDRIVQYVKADPSVNGIFVDGHSDSYGSRIRNRELSKERAEIVARYLVDAGLNEEMITTRYHGDRYPVASNATAANRARNRRATVRLERKDPEKQASQLEASPSP